MGDWWAGMLSGVMLASAVFVVYEEIRIHRENKSKPNPATTPPTKPAK